MSRASGKQRVCYFYDSDIGNYYYGQGHPMKPHRIRMAHNLLLNYGLYKKMEIYRPSPATFDELRKFHSDEYMRFLRHITPDNMGEYTKQMQRFNVGEDCPVFEGLYQFCQASSGGSIGGAVKLNKGTSDIAINWAGGLHHAKNKLRPLLASRGARPAPSPPKRSPPSPLPLQDGIDDASYASIFKPVIGQIMQMYQPGAIVLQCGADSLCGDRLGCFNLTIRGHAECVRFVLQQKVPTLILGGGGYTIRNVSRCWTYESAVVLNEEISDDLPYNDYYEYYGPDYKLHYAPSGMENLNIPENLEKIKSKVFEHLRQLQPAPNDDPDVRVSQRGGDERQEHGAEFYSGRPGE
ncbi:hypothetical protein EMIHUDRAFT_460301 [Emiliania huxleyi CCMP1516]|uniref:Histone deacetylase domain-containing protein n=2 Tax=Emiliania huxleyi TaxID=2903 RepID=A0A0D3HXB6_EMIH1|nr:hypothetical protein EMIHUDRAFT_460301 [Emiliania huxleyi CCMP1516]EOD03651.1 hypothetical protein EMIHUDRAFT_460301 [Emiliania huxleyi CCMP1516]|eukprot:XP_005756080.1 hypothetical protein EMIHUDRAFT_460301 [Emiliania huxleyi CCMP1516]